MKHQQASDLSFSEKLLTILFLVGVFMIVGSIAGVAIISEINHAWVIPGIVFVIPLIIVGFVVVFVSVKLLEIMK